MRRFLSVGCIVGFVLAATSGAAPAATSKAEAQEEVVAAGKTLDNFMADPEMTWFRNNAKNAKGIFICSKVTKAGFIIGGSGGRCVLVARGEKGWNGPAHYAIGTASIGFQAGVDVAEIVMLVQTQKGLDSFMSGDFKVGADASVSAGPVGAGTGAATSDLIVYSRSKGVYAGVDVSGSGVKPSDEYNEAYYGKPASPIDIIVRGSVHNPQANAALMSKVAKLWGGK